MHCPGCGADSTYGLNFCTQCGTNLAQPGAQPAQRVNPVKLTGMFWAIAVFGIASVAVLFGTTIAMVMLGAGEKVVVPIVGLGSGVIVGIAAMLIKQLSRLIGAAQQNSVQGSQQTLKKVIPPPQLGATPRQISSVTEHTTRSFDPPSYHEGDAR